MKKNIPHNEAVFEKESTNCKNCKSCSCYKRVSSVKNINLRVEQNDKKSCNCNKSTAQRCSAVVPR